MDVSVEFCNKINEAMNQHRLLYNQKKVQPQQFSITSFFQPLKIRQLNKYEETEPC